MGIPNDSPEANPSQAELDTRCDSVRDRQMPAHAITAMGHITGKTGPYYYHNCLTLYRIELNLFAGSCSRVRRLVHHLWLC